MRGLLVIFLLLTSTTLLHGQMYYEWYCNERFDVCIEYPADFVPQGESANGDGQLFISADGASSVLLYGRLFQSEYDHGFESFIESEQAYSEITYQLVKDNYCILSGYTNEGKIFYQKVRFLDDIQAEYWVARLEYPVELKDVFDDYCKTLANF